MLKDGEDEHRLQTTTNLKNSGETFQDAQTVTWIFPGGTPIWNRRGCSSEILNLTPKGDHLGAF